MEDFYYAGGLLGLLTRLKPFLDLAQINASGQTWAQSLEGAEVYDDDVIRPLDNPIYAEGALAVLRGNLAPNGCVIKPSAAAPRLLQPFRPGAGVRQLSRAESRDRPRRSRRDARHVLVLRNAGPLGAPGMPEWGMLPIPKKLLKQGVRDMVRISDARMSGTAYGACILHVSPESYIGGAARAGAHRRRHHARRRRAHARRSMSRRTNSRAAAPSSTPPAPRYERGYGWMFSQHVTQADQGCDFDFLQTDFGAPVAEPDIF